MDIKQKCVKSMSVKCVDINCGGRINKERLANLKQTLKKNKEFVTLYIVEQLEKENKIMEDILIDDLKKIEQLIQQIKDEVL